jgi:hypothetical protein
LFAVEKLIFYKIYYLLVVVEGLVVVEVLDDVDDEVVVEILDVVLLVVGEALNWNTCVSI